MKRFSDRHQLTTLSELNVTPLLDLAFVLLIIFMITTPLMENSSNLVLPTHKAGEGAAEPPDVETISIDRNSLVTIDKAAVEVSSVREAIANMAQILIASWAGALSFLEFSSGKCSSCSSLA